MSFARVRALAVVGLLVACAVVVVIVTIVKDDQPGRSGANSCPKGAVIADLRLPVEKNVKVLFVDASGGTVEAAGLPDELRHRGFQIEAKPDSPKQVKQIGDVAILRYGPKGVGSAWVVQANFLGSAKEDFQITNTDNVVELTVGAGFKKLATSTEVKFAFGQNGRPSAPPGTCGESDE